MEANVIKLAFLLAYLSLLVCVVSGIPFITALLRSLLMLVVFSMVGFFLRLFLLRTISSVEARSGPEYDDLAPGAEEAGPAKEKEENEFAEQNGERKKEA
jgi:hypothetical protein